MTSPTRQFAAKKAEHHCWTGGGIG